MMPTDALRLPLARAFEALFGVKPEVDQLTITPTRKEFPGDYTLLIFPLTRWSKLGPEQTGQAIGAWLMEHAREDVADFNVIKGFLNITLQPHLWHTWIAACMRHPVTPFSPTGEKVLVEFSSPNTNKPLHLGHIRNILLGWSMSRILSRVGHEVYKVQVINDRGVAICKSMLAWQLFGQGANPSSAGMKGDHLVGRFYVQFESAFREEYQHWQQSSQADRLWEEHCLAKGDKALARADFFKDYKNNYFNNQSDLGRQAREMLLAWEEGDAEVRRIWAMMNQWVYDGFQETYDRLGVSFDKVYYESSTYLLGKDLVEQGLSSGVFEQEADRSVWVDLQSFGLDRKIVQRSDGTSVYITQDLGTAEERYRDFGANRMVYVVADEQNYHFQVLFAIMKLLKAPYAEGMHHLAYGMVELPTGRMKSREGTVVDADDLMDEVIREARLSAGERAEGNAISEDEQQEIYRMVGMAALKFHLLKVNARKKMIFDPSESVDMQGHTGPYIQNAYVRIQSILEKAGQPDGQSAVADYALMEPERDLAVLLDGYREAIVLAATQFDPSHVANHAYQVAKAFHKFYHDCPILRAESATARESRLRLSVATAGVLKDALELLGMEMPRRM